MSTAATTPLNPLVQKIRTAHPGAYDDLDDATLTKRVLAKYPQYEDLAAPGLSSVPRPQVNVHEMSPIPGVDALNAATGHPGFEPHPITPIDLAQGAARDISNLSVLTPIRQGLQAVAPGFVAKHPSLQPPPPEDIIRSAVNVGQGMALGGVEAGEVPRPQASAGAPAPAPSAMPPAPDEMLGLTPEQRAEWSQQRGAAWQDYTKKAQAYSDKVTNAFDTAKREHGEAVASHAQDVADIQAKHAADVAQAQEDFKAATEKERAAKATWDQKMQAAQESKAQAAEVEARRQALTQTQQAMAEDTRQQAQQLYQQHRADLNTRWDAVRDQVGADTPAPIQGVVDALNKAENEYLRGSPGSVVKFRQLANELGLSDSLGVADEAEGDLTKAPAGKFWEIGLNDTAPWQTLRTHASNISRAMASGDLGNLYPAMKVVRDAIERVNGQVAEQRGAGDMYRSVRTDEAQFRKDFEDLGPVSLGKGNPAARLVRAPNAAYASDIIHGKASDLLQQAIGRWDKTGDIVGNLQHMGAMAEELKNLPKVKVLSEPAPYTGQAPVMQEVPAPTMPSAPTIPERTVPSGRNAPVPQQVPRPKPEPAKPGFLRKHVIPRAGGLAAAELNVPVPGHFIINYEAGKAGAQALMNKFSRRSMPPTPEAYMREAMGAAPDTKAALAAKYGLISRGKADTEITKSGKSVRVRPIPQPPE